MSEYWTNYWSQGHLTSFGDAKNYNYQGDLANNWTRFFQQFQSGQKVILDVGTGNGALIDLALSEGLCVDNMLIGVDYAKLSVPQHLQVNNVRFLQSTNVEQLPLEDESIDVVISQYGIEYSNLDKSLTEVFRILKQGGCFRFVVHASNSVIVQPNKRILEAIVALRAEQGGLKLLKDLLHMMRKFGRGAMQTEAARYVLNQELGRLNQQNRNGLIGTNFPILLKSVLNPALKEKDRKTMLKQFEHEMVGQQQRLMELTAAAKSNEELDSVIDNLATLGFDDIDKQPVNDNGDLIGILLSGTKHAS